MVRPGARPGAHGASGNLRRRIGQVGRQPARPRLGAGALRLSRPTPALFESVPNFSEGRLRETVLALESAAGRSGAMVLDSHADTDHNRTVVTLVAAQSTLLVDALFDSVTAALERIDLRVHTGLHPRVGAADVVPLVPLGGAALEECVEAAWSLGVRVWRELGVPVYWYAAAARRPEARRLAEIRAGRVRPDLGLEPHPSAGAVCIGARPPLVAYNVVLQAVGTAEARLLAARLRESSGGLTGVQALVFRLADGSLQLSTNLTDLAATPLGRLRAELKKLDVSLAKEELVGLCPAPAAGAAPLTSGRLLEARIAAAAAARGASACARLGDAEHMLLAGRLEAEAAAIAGLGPSQEDLLGGAERAAALVRVMRAAGVLEEGLRAALEVAALGLRSALDGETARVRAERLRLLDAWLAEP